MLYRIAIFSKYRDTSIHQYVSHITSHSAPSVIMFSMTNAVPEQAHGGSEVKRIIDSTLTSTAWKTTLIWIQRWSAKPKVSVAISHLSGVLYTSGHRFELATKLSVQYTNTATFIRSVAFSLRVVGLSINMKASVTVSLSNSSLSCCHRISLNINLCTKMATFCKLRNLDHAMKVLYMYIIIHIPWFHSIIYQTSS